MAVKYMMLTGWKEDGVRSTQDACQEYEYNKNCSLEVLLQGY